MFWWVSCTSSKCNGDVRCVRGLRELPLAPVPPRSWPSFGLLTDHIPPSLSPIAITRVSSLASFNILILFVQASHVIHLGATTNIWNNLPQFPISYTTTQGMLGALIVWWPASFWLQWTMAEGTYWQSCKVPNQTHRGMKKNRKMYAIKQIRSVQNTGTCYPGLGWICQVHLGFGLSTSAQVPDKPALVWVACPGILHRS